MTRLAARARRFFCFLTSCALLFCAAPVCAKDAASFQDKLTLNAAPTRPAPFVFETADGVQKTLADYRGRYVVLNIWATWCGPCAREMPSLAALQARLGDALVVLPVSEDRGDALVARFYQMHGLTDLPILLDRGGLAPSTLRIPGLPTTLILDPQGREIARLGGEADWTSPEAMAYFASLGLKF